MSSASNIGYGNEQPYQTSPYANGTSANTALFTDKTIPTVCHKGGKLKSILKRITNRYKKHKRTIRGIKHTLRKKILKSRRHRRR